MARAMVLGAGLGTRLRPLTDELPKPLVPVGDRSVFGHIAATLRAAGISSAVLNTHHLADRYLSCISDLDIEVNVVHEAEILGTAGGVANARALLGPCPVLVWNGDILATPPIAQLLSSVSDGLALALAPRPKGEGTVGIDRDGNVVRLRGEHFGTEERGGDYIGVAAIGERCLATLPARGCLIGDWALPELRAGRNIVAVDAVEPWSDIGDVTAYAEANQRWLDRTHADHWVHVEATVEPGVSLERSLVGRGARVEGSGSLRNCIIWPNARVRAPLSDAVVLTSGKIVLSRQADAAVRSRD